MCHSQMSEGRVDRVATTEPVLTSASLCVGGRRGISFWTASHFLSPVLLFTEHFSFFIPPPLNGSAEKSNSSVDYPEK